MNDDLDETGGTKEPVSSGIDKLYPDDCGRDKDKGTGLLCFPDGELCKNSKSNGEASKMSCDWRVALNSLCGILKGFVGGKVLQCLIDTKDI